MGNGVINIKESDMQAIANHLAKSSNDVSICSSDISSGIKSFTKVGLFSNGANTLSEQMNTLSDGISRLGTTVLKQYEDMADTEKSLKVKAEAISIPRDFITNDTSQDISMRKGNLEKEDGKGVNAKDNTKEEALEFNSSITYNENLKDIVKEYEKRYGEVEIKGTKASLSNIKNYNELEIIKDIEESVIEREMLTNINANFLLKENNIDMDSLSLNKISLTQLNYGSLRKSIYDDSYIVNKKTLYRPV